MNNSKQNQLFLIAIITAILAAVSFAAPMPGQIIVDPNHKHMLALNQDKNGDGKKDPFYLSGHGGPEGLFYNGYVKGWDADKIVEYIIKNGGNGVYVNAWGNDYKGKPTDDKLKEMKSLMEKLDKAGVATFFIMYDDGVRHQGDDAIRKIVNKLKHIKKLIWCVAEESDEAKVPVTSITKVIKDADEFNHPVANHDHYYKGIDQHAYQITARNEDDVHKQAVDFFNKGKGKYSLNSAEDHYLDVAKADDDRLRKSIWALATAGNHFMQLGSWEPKKGRKPPSITTCKYMKLCYTYIMSIYDYNSMRPADEIVREGKAYAFGKPGHYILYLKNGGRVRVDLKKSKGDMNVYWYNPRNGELLDGGVETGGSEQIFTAPDNNKDWVLQLGGNEPTVNIQPPIHRMQLKDMIFQNSNILTIAPVNTGNRHNNRINILGRNQYQQSIISPITIHKN